MFKLPFIIVALLLTINVLAFQSPHGKLLSTKCEVCHTTGGWTKIKTGSFNHNQTGFPLAGQHQTVSCKSCHVDLVFSNAKKECNDCHKDVHQGTVGQDCKRCHTESTWIVSNISKIHEQTRFPLRDSHKVVDCNRCHKSASLLRFDPMNSQCVDCHLGNYNSNPTHVSKNFSKECVLCHSTKNWESSTFDHNTTSFPLTGGHQGVDCKKCHLNGYSGISSECVSCHLTNYNATTKPNHSLAKISTDCKTCHNTNNWSPAKFDHDVNTAFPLIGGHKGVDCIKCHANGYINTPSTCVSCHKTNFDATTNPNHLANKFSTECQTCHNSTAWQPSTFNHNTTSFPLTGLHSKVACGSCHTNGYTGGTPTTCLACHKATAQAVANPNHTAANFLTACESCHTTSGWIPSSFNHTMAAHYELKGSHKGLTCNSCHSKGYAGTGNKCIDCHLVDYNKTTNPPHASNNFKTDCESCHTENTWQPSTFNHATTSFPLTGLHSKVACGSCHTNGYTGGTPTTCLACHKATAQAVANPNHTAANFLTACESCHTTSGWIPSKYVHPTTFKLTGGHSGLTCNKCHSKGYTGTSTACVSCHQADYNATKSPAHAAAKFPLTCELCHTISGWIPAKDKNHDAQYFKIYSGKHRGKWSQCTECHTNASNYGVFSCIVCHEHSNKASVDADHRGKPGYVYSATSCFQCHSGV